MRLRGWDLEHRDKVSSMLNIPPWNNALLTCIGAACEATAGGGWAPKRLPEAGPGPVARLELAEAAAARPVDAAWLRIAGETPELATEVAETPRFAEVVTEGALEATGGGVEAPKGGGDGANAGGSKTGLGLFPSRPSKPRLGPCPSCCPRSSCSSSLMVTSGVSSCCCIKLSS